VDTNQVVQVVYTNYRGETAKRTILPRRIWFGTCEWYPEDQWLLDAFDLDRGADRTFALKNIRSWLEGDRGCTLPTKT
jgi:predicted DNA-binding transcriptional regulator YafY